MLDVVGHRRGGGYGDASWIVQHLVGQLGDFLGQRRRGEEGLPLCRKRRHDASHIANESHVQHSIRFIEDSDFHRVESNLALTHQVEQATGGGDQNLWLAPQLGDLGARCNAADNDGTLQRKMTTVRFEILLNLQSQFARRCQNEGTQVLATCGSFMQMLKHRQRKSSCLAGTRLGCGENVPACKGIGNRVTLNRRRCGVALIVKGTQKLRDERQALEGCFRIHEILSGMVKKDYPRLVAALVRVSGAEALLDRHGY